MRAGRSALCVASIALAPSAGCAPTRTYPGPERPRSEVALLRETTDATVVGIDGAPAFGSSWTLLPGPHEVFLGVRIFTETPNVDWMAWSYCLTRLETLRGEEYEARVRIHKEIAPGLSERVSIEVGIADAGGVLRAVPKSCTPARPKFDR